MIRTETVSLTVIPANAYRQKLPAGGAGIVILRNDSPQPGIASISKTSGEPILTGNTSAEFFPKQAFCEAIALTAGMPYKKRGAPELPGFPADVPADEEEAAYEIVVDGADYQKIVDAYTDKDGKLSYALLNKEFIQFAHRSSVVRDMNAKKTPYEKIRLYIAGSRFRSVTGNRDLSDDQVGKIAELLDGASPKGLFRELNEALKKMRRK
ncbi:MAG: hypothetical protein II889_05540 [Clostridia bacterium]|nr:hypothetical protein [Clostridia bacterium]MCR4906345.1 hypothetical protein [Clostridiales bacterium]